MAISVNGKITQGKDDSAWVSNVDWNEFDKLMKDCGVMVMGKRTYEIFGEDFPCEGALNIVMTSNKDLLKQKAPNNALFTNKTPTEVTKLAEEKGYKKLMLIGGEMLNTSFLKENLVDEIWLSMHPLYIGKGLEISQEFECFKNLTLLGIKELEQGLVQLKYKVNK
jgi:dihydrofolate reductase